MRFFAAVNLTARGATHATRLQVAVDQAFFPWTTGTAYVFDSGGQFGTIRTSMGTDNRNPAGTSGTLQIVSPWVFNLTPFLDLYEAGTARVTFQFVPEPSITLAFAAGAAALTWLHGFARRRSHASRSGESHTDSC